MSCSQSRNHQHPLEYPMISRKNTKPIATGTNNLCNFSLAQGRKTKYCKLQGRLVYAVKPWGRSLKLSFLRVEDNTLRDAFWARRCSYSLLMRFTSALREAFSSFKTSARCASSSHSAWFPKTKWSQGWSTLTKETTEG